MNNQFREIEKSLFSSIQSEYYKLDNILKKKKLDKNLLNNLNSLNNDVMALELKIKQVRLSLLDKDKYLSNGMNEKDKSDLKDIKTIENFKSIMIYYRMMLDYI